MTNSEFEDEFNEAMRLKNVGLNEDAVQVLGRLIDKGLHREAVVGMLGLIHHYELHNSEQALPFLRQAVELAPRSERFSLGLFHALLSVDQIDEAFEEMRRYLKDNTSDAYDEFLRDVNAR